MSNEKSVAREYDMAEQLIAASGAQDHDHVMIAGLQHVELLTALCRRGFVRVTCRGLEGPSVSELPTDILLVPSLTSEAELGSILVRLGRNLRPNGVLIVRYTRWFSGNRAHGFRQLLGEHSFLLTQELLESSAYTMLLYARKLPRMQMRAA